MTDAIDAASICLFDPVQRRVLIGRRKTEPGLGLWSFPGGRIQPGETALEAGLRELEEETGLRLGAANPQHQQAVTVEADGERFRITCSTFICSAPAEPRETAELAARWLSLPEARELKLAPGTLTVLEGLPVAPNPPGV